MAMVHPKPPAGRDIYIVSSPRSGSTWLMDALGAQPGFGCANEPLHKRRLHLLPACGFTPRWRYDHVPPDEAASLLQHLTDRGRLRPFLNIQPLRHSFSARPDRLVVKSVRAAPILPWLVENLPGHVVYLCRHPIPQAMSASRRSHAVRGEEYLDRARAGRPALSEQQLRRLDARTRVALTGTPIENGLGDLWSILDWANPGLLGPRAAFISQLTPDKANPHASSDGEQALRALNGILVYRRTKAEPSIA